MSRIRRMVQADFESPEFREQLDGISRLLDDPKARLIHEGRNRIGVIPLTTREGNRKDVVVKEFRIRGVDRLKTLCRASKGIRAWRGARILQAGGMLTPEPVAAWERRRRFLVDESYYLSEEIKEAPEIRGIFRSWPEKRLRLLLESLARYLRAGHEAGVFHRDLSDGNILVKEEDSGEFHFFLIDTNRIRRKKHLGKFRGVKNLIRLGIPAEQQSFFLQKYLDTRQSRPLFWIWYRFNKTWYSRTIALKKILRLKKLVRKLGLQ